MRRIASHLLTPFLLLAACSPAMQLPAQAPPEVRLEVITQEPAERTAGPSRVLVVEDLEQLPNDYWTHGTYGDLLLRNDFSGLLFGAIPEEGTPPNQMRQGSILDVFSSPAAPENFHLFQPTLSASGNGRTVLATAMDYWEDEEAGTAFVVVFGEDTRIQGLSVDTTYEMSRAWPGVKATTVVTNETDETVTIPVLGDYVGWGAMGVFLAGSGWAGRAGLLPEAEFIFGRLHDSHIMVAPMDGLMDVVHQVRHSVLVHESEVEVEAGGSVEYQRWLLVGQDDPGDLFSFVNRQKEPRNFGIIAGRVQERLVLPDGGFLESSMVPDTEVRISVIRRPDLPSDYVNRPYIYTRTDENGNFQIMLPPGEYTASPASPARIFNPSNIAIRVRESAVAAVDQAVSGANSFVYEVVDAETGAPIPAKLTFLPLRDTQGPDLGPPGSLRTGNVVYSRSGSGLVELPVGNYRVVASHGNEYHMEEQRVRVQSIRAEKTRFELRRAFKPEGWISADIGVMTEASPHSRTTAEDRVVSAVAEGLGWIVTADTLTATDLQPVIERLGFADRIRASTGMRFTSTANRQTGEYLLFPLSLCGEDEQLDVTAFEQAATPAEAIEALRSICSAAVLVAGKPIFPQVGMLTLQGFDFATGRFEEGVELAAGVDALQVWEGKRQGVIQQSLLAYYGLLSRGFTPTPVAYSLSPGTLNEEPGYPRMYIPSETRDPRRLDPEALAGHVREGRVMITNGPFIDMRVNGEPMGSTVTAENGAVEVEFAVHTPNWANVGSVTVNLNGQFVRKFIIPAGAVESTRGRVYPTSEEREFERFRLTVREDSVLQILVEGDPALPQDPVNPLHIMSDEPNVARGQRTFAISAPVFIDADGDGEVNIRIADPADPEPGEYVPPF